MNTHVIHLKNITKYYGNTRILEDIGFTLAKGKITVLLGNSGSGKTTLLRMIAGFEKPDSGSIYLNGRCVAAERVWVRPHQRGIGFVPQDGLLFPHLTVAKNIALGLSRKGNSGNQIDDMLQLIDMPGMGQRYPHELSGGQQQRVALARAMATQPALILLDEPFSALDSQLRRNLCADVRNIIKTQGASAIMVTHDRDEAFSVGDDIAIIENGKIVQHDSPPSLYLNPVSREAAQLTGPAVFMPATLSCGYVQTPVGSFPARNPWSAAEGPVEIMLRPEQLVPASAGECGSFRARVERAATVGPNTWLDLLHTHNAHTRRLSACWPGVMPPSTGSDLTIAIKGDILVMKANPDSQ